MPLITINEVLTSGIQASIVDLMVSVDLAAERSASSRVILTRWPTPSPR